MCCYYCFFFFCKQKTAYEMRISDWSSDVCSSDLVVAVPALAAVAGLLVGSASSPAAGPWPVMIATAAGAFVGLNLGVLYLAGGTGWLRQRLPDRKSTRLNSSH